MTPNDFNEYDVVGALAIWVCVCMALVALSGYWFVRCLVRLFKGKGK